MKNENSDQLTAEQEKALDAMALFVAEPEFDLALATHFMGWTKGDDPLQWYERNDDGYTEVAPTSWSPMRKADDALQLMQSPKWVHGCLLNVGIVGGGMRAIVYREKQGRFIEVSQHSEVSTAIALAAIRMLNSPNAPVFK